MIKELIVNIAILSTALFFFNSFLPKQVNDLARHKFSSKLSHGFAMGVLGTILMFFSFHVTSSFFLDFRQLAIVAAALFGGTLASVVASIIIGIARLIIQGEINPTTLVAFASVLTLGIVSGQIVKYIKNYVHQWIAFFTTMSILTILTTYYILDTETWDILPIFFAVSLAGSTFTSYLLYFLSQSNLRQLLLKQSEQNYRRSSSLQEAVFQSASEVSIIVTDPKGIITIFNRGAEKMLGYTAAEVINLKTPIHFHLESEVRRRGEELSQLLSKKIEGFDVFAELPRIGRSDEQEWTYVRKDNSCLTVNMFVTALWFEGEVTGFIGISTDISDMKRAGIELLERNEELQAQQEELQAQQEELTEILEQMEENKQNLLKRNKLSQSLRNTLDKSQLLYSVIESYVNIYRADKGILAIFNDSDDYAAFGISDALAIQFLTSLDDAVKPRVVHQKTPFTIKREATTFENGFHETPTAIYDFFTPILNAEGEVTALLVISRTGQAFSEQETKEAISLALQISPSLDKLYLYEDTLKQQELTQDMLDTIQEGVQLLDTSGTIIQINKQFSALMGTNEWTGMSLETFISYTQDLIDQPDQLATYMHKILTQPENKHEGFTYRMNGLHTKVIHVYAEPLYRGYQIYGLLIVHRDITKEFELDKLKSDFVNTVSHELRTPLSSIHGFAELLKNKSLTPEKQSRYIGTIHKEAIRLTGLINDFLDLQRMESGRQTYSFVQMNLVETCYNVIELMKEQLDQRHFVFDYATSPALIYGDENRIKQLIMNLLSNALKYSPNGGTITLSIEQLSPGEWSLSIQDEGLGIPAEALPHLFDKFYRVDNSDRRQIGGTGLGLAIVKEIIDVHKAKINVSSEYGKGSLFTCTLPMYEIFDSITTLDAVTGG